MFPVDHPNQVEAKNVSRHYPFDIEILVSQITYTSFLFYDTVIY